MGPHPYPDIVAKMQSVISEELKWQLQEKVGVEIGTGEGNLNVPDDIITWAKIFV